MAASFLNHRPGARPLLGLTFLCLLHVACGGAGADATKPAQAPEPLTLAPPAPAPQPSAVPLPEGTAPVVASPVVTSPVVVSPLVTPPASEPVIEDFRLEPGAILPGEPVVLKAVFHGGTGRVEPGVGEIATGVPVTVNATADTVYTLTVTGSGGQSVQSTATLKVLTPPAPPATHTVPPSAKEDLLPAGLYVGQGPSGEAVRALLLADGRFWATAHSAFRADGEATLIQGKVRREGVELQTSLAIHPPAGLAVSLARPLDLLSPAPSPRVRITLPIDGAEGPVVLERQSPLAAPAPRPKLRGRFQGPLLATRERRPTTAAPPFLTLDLEAPGSFTGQLVFDPSTGRAAIPVHGTWKAGTGSEAFALTLDLQGDDPALTPLLGAQACQVQGVYDGETRRLRLASLGQDTPWAAACLGPFGSGGAPFDSERDVLPFDSVRVPHWPGLTNVGGSCYVNVSLKLLAATADLDPFLLDHPGDDAATARLRGTLRDLVTFIRSGTDPIRPHGCSGRELLTRTLDALRHHPTTAPPMVAVGSGGGGNDFEVMATILRALGAELEFKATTVGKEVFLDPPASRNSWKPSSASFLISSRDPILSGVPTSLPYTLATLFREQVGKSFVLNDRIVTSMPTQVPRNQMIHLFSISPVEPLRFSEEVEIPVFEVDRATGEGTHRRTVRMKVAAITQSTPSHVWAMIRGDNQWYKNDDDQPVHPVSDVQMDEVAGAPDELAIGIFTVLLRRVDP
jgi:hypothetical protein